MSQWRFPAATRQLLTALLLLFLGTSHASATAPTNDDPYPIVEMETSMGTIVVELDAIRAPLTVAHFLQLVQTGSYSNTLFHRVIPGFVVQGGGLDPNKQALPEGPMVVNESGNGLTNSAGTIAMARTNDPHSATRQFYFNVGDNPSLNPSARRWGYTVFGRIVEGEDVLEQISKVPTQFDPQLNWPDVPVEPVILKQVRIRQGDRPQ